MNANELKAQMIRKDKSAEQLCAALGISKATWWRKINGHSVFNQREIVSLRRELCLDNKQTMLIFFNEEVS